MEYIDKHFPNMIGKYTVTSPQTYNYNCIALAAGETDSVWWPNINYWPSNIPNNTSLSSFKKCFENLGFKDCNMNHNYETGFDKVAIFIGEDGLTTHAARQFDSLNGMWKSKLGPQHNIIHDLFAMEGEAYGSVALIMKMKV